MKMSTLSLSKTEQQAVKYPWMQNSQQSNVEESDGKHVNTHYNKHILRGLSGDFNLI